ncbi:putative spermidine/putrescine transport system permease protein [Kitasatospora sp. GAS204A]|uniref:ABC transporter permease n=1 Tax=unclassified Kitasatospora TaxID=2633591 RepID=UPI0024767BB8|nr:ABC transporter permease [Kitasatospora sp. GAS204B]MDH6121401.1 putative spermidine/putrescine transport system permease protein [Kitasatospora sp. GAS204B]
MTAPAATRAPDRTPDRLPARTPVRRLAGALHRRPGLRLAALLAAPMTWLVLAYLGSLTVLLLSAFWTTNEFTSNIEYRWTADNFRSLLTDPQYRTVALRTLGIAASVTVIDAVIALPMAFYIGRVARPGSRRLLLVAVLTPLWAGYLVKAYAWWVMLSHGGVLDWVTAPFGGHSPGFGVPAVVMVLGYLWLPYMVLPLCTAFEQLPDSLLAAAADLGAGPWRTLRTVVLPMVRPALIAGSIFTFSLSLGDYLAVQIVGGTTSMLGNVIASNVTLNLPLAAAVSCVPVLLIIGYLLAVRRTGALDSL